LTPKSRDGISLTRPAAHATPRGIRRAAILTALRRIKLAMSDRDAPSADRIPISRVRRATLKAVLPYTPTAARSAAVPAKIGKKEMTASLKSTIKRRLTERFVRPSRRLITPRFNYRRIASKDPEAAISVVNMRKANPEFFESRSWPMPALADLWSTFGPGRVADKTRLDGLYANWVRPSGRLWLLH
jgi:hypothetical protein